MKPLFVSSFFTLCILLPAFGAPPLPFVGYTVRPLDPTTNLLSGMTWTSDGLAVCDRGAGTLLLIRNNRTIEVILDGLNTPVDVVERDSEWLILQEMEGTLIAVDKKTLRRRTLAKGFVHPTAFTLDDRNTAYVTEFDTGFLFRANLETGALERIHVLLDRPADILFVPPDSLYVADQIGMDMKEGMVIQMTRSGKPQWIERGIVDPSGLALSPSGDVYVSSFAIRMPSSDGRKPPINGGVVRLRAQNPPEIAVTGLWGPTSILFKPDGELIVLEEPTDSIFCFSARGERKPILEGFAPVEQAARDNKGDIFVIEKAPPPNFKIQKKDGFISAWEHPPQGTGDWSKMTADGQGYVYFSDPLTSRIQVYDGSGNPIRTYDDILPSYMMGIPTGGIFLLTQKGNSFAVSRLKLQENLVTFPIDLESRPITGFARSEDRFLICQANGEIQDVWVGSSERRTLVPGGSGFLYYSSSPDWKDSEKFWLLDANRRILFYDGTKWIPAVQADESGILLPDSNGVLFIGKSGKRFLIQEENSAVSDWVVY